MKKVDKRGINQRSVTNPLGVVLVFILFMLDYNLSCNAFTKYVSCSCLQKLLFENVTVPSGSMHLNISAIVTEDRVMKINAINLLIILFLRVDRSSE